ncbi:hypothetical protein PEp14_00030 [Erwinia phage PEp14]|uniref:Uncharacterized protein n=1 Tax=Erwinia phage PEp14 TaxID=1131315 RepID=H2DE60_9CAUD|nr:hypothetical protein PEp14_00030 [Erwinia phage PEp14]AEY69619.1 hypothetical protein PEp14_00030 [Erwinia phage PEp14]
MSHNHAGKQCPGDKSPWKSWEMWGVLCFLVASGGIAGATITNYVVQNDAHEQIAAVKTAYEEAGKSRLQALTMCLNQTTGAANQAASAAIDAAAKASAAQEAADKAAAAVTAPNADVPR